MAGLSVARSLRVRGVRRILLFAALGSAVPLSGEHLTVNVLKLLHHHVRPQVEGIALAIALAWYNIVYGTFVVMESILEASGPGEVNQKRALAPAVSAVPSLDLLLDPAGIDLGLWQWSGDGPYAAEVEGPNGKRGVPLLNVAGWIGLATGVVLTYQRLGPGDDTTAATHARMAGGSQARHGAALVLLSYYLPAAA
jgi:uncharacterized membrane protein